MLIIRNEQMRILGEDRLRRFEEDMVRLLKERFPRSGIVAETARLRLFVAEGLKLAKKFGITEESDMRRFLELRAEYGEDFHQSPWARKVLRDKTLSGCGKIEQLDAYTLFVLRPGRNG